LAFRLRYFGEYGYLGPISLRIAIMTGAWCYLAVAAEIAALSVYGLAAVPPWLSPLTADSLLAEAGRLARTVDMSNPAEVANALGVKLNAGKAHPSLPLPKTLSFQLSER
jgi:hypothetical protein